MSRNFGFGLNLGLFSMILNNIGKTWKIRELFFHETPGSAPEADWWLLAQLLERDANLVEVRKTIEQNDERFAGLSAISAEATGLRLSAKGALPPAAEKELPLAMASDTLALLTVAGPVGSSWLAHLSSPLAATEPQPYVCLHPEQAELLGFAAGDRASLTTRFGHCYVVIRTAEQMVSGLVIAPQLWETALEGMVPGSMFDCRLEKEGKA